MATHSSLLPWEIPWTEEPGGLQSMGSQRVRHNPATKQNNLLFSQTKLNHFGRRKELRLASEISMYRK